MRADESYCTPIFHPFYVHFCETLTSYKTKCSPVFFLHSIITFITFTFLLSQSRSSSPICFFPLPTSPLTFPQCGDHQESRLGFRRSKLNSHPHHLIYSTPITHPHRPLSWYKSVRRQTPKKSHPHSPGCCGSQKEALVRGEVCVAAGKKSI